MRPTQEASGMELRVQQRLILDHAALCYTRVAIMTGPITEQDTCYRDSDDRHDRTTTQSKKPPSACADSQSWPGRADTCGSNPAHR